MKYIDIHCHLNFKDYDHDIEDVIKRAGDADVGIINVGTDVESSEQAVGFAHKYPDMWATIGVHPNDTKKEIDFGILRKLSEDNKVVAIGECGLDYFRSKPEDIARQRDIFIEHIKLANEVNKPLMLHIRNGKNGENAYQEALHLLKQYSKVSYNFHFFSGTIDDLKSILELGGKVSFTGVLTFTADYNELVKYAPLDRIMTETDAPFVTPVPHRGRRNEPSYVQEVVKAIAYIRGENAEKVAQQCVDNAIKIFHI